MINKLDSRYSRYTSVDTYIGQLRAPFRDHNDSIHGVNQAIDHPNTAAHPSVKIYLKAETQEQLRARVLPKQAEHIFVEIEKGIRSTGPIPIQVRTFTPATRVFQVAFLPRRPPFGP